MRLLTRSDFDGLGCAAILKERGIIDCWTFVHPKDIQDGLIEVTDNDVLANVPYVEGCKMWFDHHSSESERLTTAVPFEGEARIAPSAARIIYEYYGGRGKMPNFSEMVEYVDKVDSGNLTIDEILNPKGWVLLGFIMDPRTGLGRFRNFTISNYALMDMLIDCCRTMSIEDILELADIKERIEVYDDQAMHFKTMVKQHTKVDKNVIITDLRGVDTIYTGNRFLIYSLYPEQNISIWIIDRKNKIKCAIAVGHSVLNKTSNTNVGNLLLKFGGGGHHQVGTCQVDCGRADDVIEKITNKIKIDG